MEFNRFEFIVFPSLRLVASPRLKNLVCPTILPIAGGRIIGFIPFPKVLVLCEMQSVRSRIWTCVAVSISCNDNHYTTGRQPDSHHNFLFMQFRFLKVFRCFVRLKLLSQWFIIIIKKPLFWLQVTIHNGSFKFYRNSTTQFKMLNCLTFPMFMWNSFIEFLHFVNFFEMIQYCWNVDSHCLRHFSDT